jgi:error-prone DNA polymerase
LDEPRLSESKLISKKSRPLEKAVQLEGVGDRDDGFPLPHGRGDEFHHGSPGIDPCSLPPKGPKPRDIYVPDLHIDSIKVKTRDFR